jgi:hypothetical protein
MVMAVIIMGCVTFFSLLVTSIAIYSAYKANKANSIVAEQFVKIVLDNGNRIDVFEDGKHKYSTIQFPNSEGGIFK